MKVQELRIGFHYLYKGSVFQMDNTTLSRILMMGGEYDYHGIPLTEQVLLDCGFKKDGIETILDTGNITLAFNNAHLFLLIDGQWIITPTEYLHQLQNLYFALTGTELQYNQQRPT